MKNTNKMSDFDKHWRKVFDNAEASHADGVWDKIDSALSKQEAGYFRKRAFLFKALAAASVIFALAVGLFSVNFYLDQNTYLLTVEQPIENVESLPELEEVPTITELKNRQGMEKSRIDESISSPEVDQKGGQNNSHKLPEDSSPPANLAALPLLNSSEVLNHAVHVSVDENERELYQFNDLARLWVKVDKEDVDLYGIDHIYLIPIMPKGASKAKPTKDDTGFLAGLDFSTGVFDPNFQQGASSFAGSSGNTFANARVESVNDQLASFDASNKDFLLVRSAGQETKPEIAYSYGANFGFRVSRRIILQSGIAYRKATTTTTTRGYFEDLSSNTQIPIVASYSYQLAGLSAVKRTEETDLRNQYEFASIPLRAGYIFLDRKINLTLMAGISSELFLNNKIGGNNDQFETLSTSAGEGSPYRSIYFNGSLGTMMGYTFAKNYLITLEPSYRFAMNSFTKDDFYLNSFPSSFMVSFGVAYNFR